MNYNNESLLNFLLKCTDKTDAIACDYFNQANLEHTYKQNKTPVTQADLEIEKYFRNELKNNFPEIEIYGEEFGQCPQDAKLKLIIDPIDGTLNFIRGIPFFATLLAIEKEGEITVGLVSAPQTGERWWATKGQGSYYNGSKISVSKIKNIRDSQVFHGSLFGPEANELPDSFMDVLSLTNRQRGVGDYYSHMLVAMGCGEFALDFGFKPWDIAPIKIIIEEAGGVFTDAQGKKDIYSGSVISSNGLFHAEILKLLSGRKAT
ncbi:inositol monophosphatase family protein [Candidatus Margulisiibacteriota bacterium]